MTDAVITKTRTEITTEEVTETRYRCYVCEMEYDEADVMKIGLDRQSADGTFREGVEPRAERTICRHCADGLFEYEAAGDGAFDESATPYDADWVTTTAALGTVLVLVTVPVAAIAAGVAMAGGTATLVLAPVAGVLAGFLAGAMLT